MTRAVIQSQRTHRLMLRQLSVRAVLVVVLASGLVVPAAAQVDTPENLAQAIVDTMAQGDWRAMAGLMHPDALAQLSAIFRPVLDSPDAEDFLAEYFEPSTEGTELTDADIFAGMMRFSLAQDPELGAVLRTATVDVIGSVPEGVDTVHVVYRMDMTVEGMHLSQMDVLSARAYQGGWLGLLQGDISAIAQAIARAFDESNRTVPVE